MAKKSFTEVVEGPGLDHRNDILENLQSGMPFISKSTEVLQNDQFVLVDRTSLYEALCRAYDAGCLGGFATLQAYLDCRDEREFSDLDLSLEIVRATTALDAGLLLEPTTSNG